MPIDLTRYSDNWTDLALKVKEAAGLIVLDIISFKVLPLQAQNINSETVECKNAIASVKSQLTKGRQLKIERSLIDDLEFIPGRHPKGRPNQYSFSMSGTAVDSVMVSPVFLNSLATQIVNNCNSMTCVYTVA